MSRRVSGLVWVQQLDAWPREVPRPRIGARTKAKREGYKFEAAFASALAARFPCAQHGFWLRFRDANGWGLAQPDVVVRGVREAVVFECKLSYTEAAEPQLTGLYLPLLRYLWQIPVRGVVVCKALTPRCPREIVTGDLAHAIGLAKNGVPVLHWLGKQGFCRATAQA